MASTRYWPTGPKTEPGTWNWNTKAFRTITLTCQALNTAYSIQQFNQHLYAPDGMQIVVKAHNFNNIASLILVATNAAEAISAQSAYPLAGGEVIQYYIQDAAEIWVSTNFLGPPLPIVIFSVEQEG